MYQEHRDKDKNNEHFKYQYYLSKSRGEFQEWLPIVNQCLEKDRALYIQREYKLLIHPFQKYKLLSQLRSSVLAYVLQQHLKSLIESFKQNLIGQGKTSLQKLEEELYICAETFRVILEIGYEKNTHQQIKTLFDKIFVLVHNPLLVLQIAFCIRLGYHSNDQTKKLNVLKYDPTTPLFYEQSILKYSQKYPELITKSDFEVQNHSPDLYKRVFDNKISNDDRDLILVCITSKIFENKMNDPIVRTFLLTFKYIKLSILANNIDIMSEDETTIPQNTQYEKLINNLIPMAQSNKLALKAILLAQPGLFLEVQNNKRPNVGIFEKWIVDQIQGIEAFIDKRQISDKVVPHLLTKEGISQFLEIINEVVLYVQFVFQATTDVQIYQYYMRIIEFLKRCYFSYRTSVWFVSVNFLIEMENNSFENLHMDIDKQIIATVTQLITKEQLPTWVEYCDGKIIQTPVTKFQVVSAIIYYLKQCHQQDNNFFEFPQPLPVNLPSSILLVELVRIRFHEFEPNQQQMQYYRTVFQECIKHNVNPGYTWFKGLDAVINQYDRQIEYDMIKQIKNQEIKKIFHNIINTRQIQHIQKCLDQGINPLQLVNQLKYSLYLSIKKSQLTIRQNQDEIIFELLMIMASLFQGQPFDITTSFDEVRLHHLHMCFELYNKRIRYSPENQQYNLIVERFILPWMKLDFQQLKLVYEKYPQFFSAFICAPHCTQIISNYIDFITQTPFQQIQKHLLQRTLLIINILTANEHKSNSDEKQRNQQLVGRIFSIYDPSLPKQLLCNLSALILYLIPTIQTWNLILSSNENMLQYWFEYVKSMLVLTFKNEDQKKQLSQVYLDLQNVSKNILQDTYNFIFVHGHTIDINFKSAFKFLEIQQEHNTLVSLCQRKTLAEQISYDKLQSGNLVLLLIFQSYKSKQEVRLPKIQSIINQISLKKEKSEFKASVQIFGEVWSDQEQTHINHIILVLHSLLNINQNSKKIAINFMEFFSNHLDQKSYFNYARQLKLPQLVQNISIQTVLRVGSDNKHLFSNFACTVQKLCARQKIIQETLDALKILKKQNFMMNAGALFFLAMIVVRQRNKQIQNTILKNLIRCHIFKVRPQNPYCEKIVVQTLKAFTVIMMQQAKQLIKQLPQSLFKISHQQRSKYSPIIDKLFGIIYCLPQQCLNQIKISNHPKSQIQQQDWQSQGQSSEDQKKTKNKKKKNGDEQQEQEQQSASQNTTQSNDNVDIDMDEEMSQHSDEVKQQEISDILLQKLAGYNNYNAYIKLRQQLDIAIKGDYIWLEKAVKNKQLLDEQLERNMAGIIATLQILQSAQKRVITKMNVHLYNALKFRGLKQQRVVDQDDNKEQNTFKPKYKVFSDSQYEYGQSDDNDSDDSDDYDDQDYEDAMEMISHALSDGDVEAFGINIDNGVINVTIQTNPQAPNPPSLQPQNSNATNNTNPSDTSSQYQPNMQDILNLNNIPFNIPVDPQIDYLLKKQSSVQAPKVQTFKHQCFTSFELDKIVQILLIKLFDFPIQIFPKYLSFYQKFAAFTAGSSSFVNSIMILLRCSQSKQFKENKQFALFDRTCRLPNQFYNSYQLFIRNAIFLLLHVEFGNDNIKYTQGQPGIESVQFIADTFNLTKQPHQVSLMLFQFRELQDQTFSNKIEQAILAINSKKGESNKIKPKHIVELVKASYDNHADLLLVTNMNDIVQDNLQQFFKAYLQHVIPLLLQDLQAMHKKLNVLEKQVIEKPQKKDSHLILMIEITNVYKENWQMVYYSIKSMLKILVKTRKKKYTQVKDQLLKLLFSNKDLILSITISMHHLNFANMYLKKPGQNPKQSVLYLIENQIRASHFIAMVHSAASKYIKFQPPAMIETYFKTFMFEPGAFKFLLLENTANLIMPLLDLESFCTSKYQKVILPPIFQNPELGYSLPLPFRILWIDDSSSRSQKINITRQCSFDIAFHELKMSKFQIQYDQQEGNDQGGLRRQFMRGWTGKGINEQFFFLGKILGIAFRDQNLYGGTLDLPMTTALTGYKPNLKLIQDIDPTVYKNLLWIKQNNADDLGLNFTRNRNYYGQQITEQLKTNGQKIQVTDKNKNEYLDLYINNFLFAGRQYQMQQLKRGFYSIIPSKCVSILTPQQLLIKLSGVDTIDIAQLKKTVRYQGYSQFSEVIKWFWQMVESFSQTQKQTFLHFLTGTHKMPLGLKNYDLTIERVHDTTRLPVAHTCFNTLDLPQYTTKTIFIQKLKTAIFEGHDTYSIM